MINKPLIGAAIAVAMVAAGVWYFLHGRQAPVPPAAPPPAPAAAQEPMTAPAPEDVIEHPAPLNSDAAPGAPLPALRDSDRAIAEALGEVAGSDNVMRYLVADTVIRHIVVTVDNLARQKVAAEKRPTAPTAGGLVVDGDELHATLNSDNYQRYQPQIAVLAKLDMARLAAVYLRFYPLFQKAYQELGYPSGYFNDRLVQVIDVLLATPQPSGPIELLRPNVMYTFADPQLESRPAGQKLLIRMGPENAAEVQAKLRELRAIVTALPPKH